MQVGTLITRCGTIRVELPAPDTILMPGILWGALDSFPSPAYWHYQVISRSLTQRIPSTQLGRTLTEEVAACLLGGHGISAAVGIAAYEKLRRLGAFVGHPPDAGQLEGWLREPLTIGQRQVHYRFAAQKARYLAVALQRVPDAPSFDSGRELRDWLMQLPGVGPKTASWVARNWLQADDVAILDVHILRVGRALGLFPWQWTVDRCYFDLEALFLQFSHAIDVRPSELDAVIWTELSSSPRLARFIDSFADHRRLSLAASQE